MKSIVPTALIIRLNFDAVALQTNRYRPPHAKFAKTVVHLLVENTPWGHASMDSHRYIKYKLDKIIKGVKTW